MDNPRDTSGRIPSFPQSDIARIRMHPHPDATMDIFQDDRFDFGNLHDSSRRATLQGALNRMANPFDPADHGPQMHGAGSPATPQSARSANSQIRWNGGDRFL